MYAAAGKNSGRPLRTECRTGTQGYGEIQPLLEFRRSLAIGGRGREAWREDGICLGCVSDMLWMLECRECHLACGLYLCADRPEKGRMRKERKGGRKEGGREKITKETKKDEEGEDEEEEDGEIHTWHMCRVVSALWEGTG